MAAVSARLAARAATVTAGAARMAHTAAAGAGEHYRVLVVGGGAGGLAVASSFGKSIPGQVGVIEPRSTHWYQPLWTLVGGGAKPLSESRRSMASVMPDGAKWVKAAFEGVDPDANKVTLSDGRSVSYDFLVVAAGIDSKWDAIKGLPEALAANNGVSSNYSPTSVENTWKNIQALERGDALFTFPSTPIKCAGAPQKIMYLASEHFAKHGRPVNVEYFNALGKMFAVDKYAKELSDICDERSITRHFFHNLVEVDAVSKQATFAKLADGAPTGETVTRSFDMLHATPPMGPIKALADSPLANSAGWIDVNQETLQHTRYPNVFSLGDCSSIPTSKTAAAVAGQNGVLKANLRSVMTGMDPTQKYDGYTSCPLVTGRNSLILAEFSGFTGQPLETFPFDQGKPSAFGYWLKAEAMPTLYWEFLLKDRWHGVAKYRKALAFLKDPAHNVSSPA